MKNFIRRFHRRGQGSIPRKAGTFFSFFLFMGCVIRRDNSYELFVIRRDCIAGKSFTVHKIGHIPDEIFKN